MATVADAAVSVTPPNPAPGPVEPEGPYEVVGGRVLEKPAMGAYEVEVACLLTLLLGNFVRERGLGRVVAEMLFRIDPVRGLERRPDVAFVSRDRWPTDRPRRAPAAWDVVPDLAVEVVSPHNRTLDDARKIEEYFRAGVRAVWVLYPDPDVAKVYAYDSPTAIAILPLDDALDGGAVVPGFRLPVRELLGDGAA